MRGRAADRGLRGVREMAEKKGNYIYHMDITDAVDYLRGCDSNR